MKKFHWSFSDGNEEHEGEADTHEEAEKAMEAAGYEEETHIGGVHERSDEAMVEAARTAKAPIKSSLQHLAEANTTMFQQIDALKNSLAVMEQKAANALFDVRRFFNVASGIEKSIMDIRELVLAWNTEQHARFGEAHVEPPFVEMLRAYEEKLKEEKTAAAVA